MCYFLYLCANYTHGMKEILIGREEEKRKLTSWLDSDRSEFIAIYGRRRVGKTFLVRETIKTNFVFHFSGSYKLSRKDQLLNFGLALRNFSEDTDLPIPDNWTLAFHELKRYLEKCKKKKKIIFLDELPWMDTPKSGFTAALENFWNDWAAWRDDIKLIVCGSATSWIINKIIRDKGGLHNRVTHTMLVKPFDLHDCEEYFKVYGFRFTKMQIAECYMTMGGIPYYFSLMDKGESLAQNIDRLFFYKDAPLKNEFDDLYRALYKNYQSHIKIIKTLAEKGIGLTRKELIDKTKLINNGEFSKMLEELELCGFIRSYLPFRNENSRKRVGDKARSETLYQLIDFYSLFYLRFHGQQATHDEHFWTAMTNSPQLNAWRGITFELLCLWHIDKIKQQLGIGDVSTHTCSWRGEYDGHKVQIDLLIVRQDNTINLCEMKFSFREFVIDKRYAEELMEKVEVFINDTNTKMNVLLTIITSNGLKPNVHSSIIQRQLTLSSLF